MSGSRYAVQPCQYSGVGCKTNRHWKPTDAFDELSLWRGHSQPYSIIRATKEEREKRRRRKTTTTNKKEETNNNNNDNNNVINNYNITTTNINIKLIINEYNNIYLYSTVLAIIIK